MIPEKLCIFCAHFKWEHEYIDGYGSDYTGPMMAGGLAECSKGHALGDDGGSAMPWDESEYRAAILKAEDCKDYQQIELPQRKAAA